MRASFNPVKSTKTRLVRKYPNGVRIYSHTVRYIAWAFIVSDDAGESWSAVSTLKEAQALAGSRNLLG